MEIKFFTEDGRTMDLTHRKLSVQEGNSMMNDRQLTKYFFPFSYYMDPRFKSEFGDFASHDSFNLEKDVKGMMLFEEKVSPSTLFLTDVEGEDITGQVDFGIELSNWNKKLSDLPLEKFSVTDIHVFAKDVAAKKYPETNFNFPRVYCTRFKPDQKVWDAFNGFYNDLNPAGTAMKDNYMDGNGEIYNTNIIHPMPYALYLLKTAIWDSGNTLMGDILTDPVLAQRCVFSGTDYFRSKRQTRLEIKFNSLEYDSIYDYSVSIVNKEQIAIHDRTVVLPKVGTYKIAGNIRMNKERRTPSWYRLTLNGATIWERRFQDDRSSWFRDEPFNMDVVIGTPNAELRLEAHRHINFEQNFQLADLLITSKALEDVVNTDLGNDSGLVINPNEVDLSRAVPDMTVGELITIYQNWFNYDLVPDGKVIWMNKIGDKEPTDIKKCEHFQIDRPRRKLLSKRSFNLKFGDLDDGETLDSMYVDKDGAELNKEGDSETTTIEINGYPMPVGKLKEVGHTTAIEKKKSPNTLALVWYDGLTAGQNNAKNPPGAAFPELYYNNWEKWLRQRIRCTEYQWKFLIKAADLDVTVKNYISCYQNIHLIKSWTKDYSYNEDMKCGVYEIDIITETIY